MAGMAGMEQQTIQAEPGAPIEIESLCPRCENNGTTRLLMMEIPHFREIVLMAFECPHCGERNSEVQFAGLIGEKGRKYHLRVEPGDLRAINRQVVKSDHATLSVPELEFEIEPGTQKAQLTTVEGILSAAAKNLQQHQEERRKEYPEVAAKIDAFCEKLESCARAEMGFTLEVSDPSGNSYVESYEQDVAKDDRLTMTYFERTKEMSRKMGLKVEEEEPEIKPDDPYHGPNSRGIVGPGSSVARGDENKVAKLMGKYTSPEEVMTFPGSCSACGADAETRMFVTNIPFFGEVIVMSNSCESCGYKNSEVKAGGGVPEKGHKISLTVTDEIDMNRDVIKSDSSSVSIPVLELTTALGTMGGIVTTVEGLLKEIEKTMRSTSRFQIGDSATAEDKDKWDKWLAKFEGLYTLKEPFEVILDDPLGHCFVTPLEDDVADDDRLNVVEYVRTEDQDLEFGITQLRLMEEEEKQKLKQQDEEGGGEGGKKEELASID